MSETTAACRIRAYEEGDEKAFVKLFNKAYENYAGFVPRTPEFWLWCCKSRPGVPEEGIIVAEAEEGVVGYAVVSNSGDVLEFCYDPESAREQIVTGLLQAVESHIVNVGANSVSLNAPIDDHIIRGACIKMGYAETSPPYAFQLSVVDFAGLIREILLSRLEKVGDHLEGEILVKMWQKPQTGSHYISLRIFNGEVLVQEGRAGNPNLVIEADKQVLISCIFGDINLLGGILTRKIKVSPFWRVSDALTLLSSLKIDDPWYFPLADYG